MVVLVSVSKQWWAMLPAVLVLATAVVHEQ